MNTLKVSSNSDPNSLAIKLVKVITEKGGGEFQVVGDGDVKQLLKAITLARELVTPEGKDVACSLKFRDDFINNDIKTAILFSLNIVNKDWYINKDYNEFINDYINIEREILNKRKQDLKNNVNNYNVIINETLKKTICILVGILFWPILLYLILPENLSEMIWITTLNPPLSKINSIIICEVIQIIFFIVLGLKKSYRKYSFNRLKSKLFEGGQE